MLCQILVDFSHNSTLHVIMEGMPQFCQRARRGYDDESLDVALVHQGLHGCSDTPGEKMLLEFMPIGVSHPSSTISARTLERTARPIAALLARGRVFVNVDTFGPEVWKLGIARVAREQRLAEGVLEVGAIGVPDPDSGEVVKIAVVKRHPELTVDELIAHCRKNLTGYKILRYVEFKTQLPKTNIGKILRRALRDQQPASQAPPAV
jgi:hypothetical protein